MKINTADKILLSLFLQCSSVLQSDGNEDVIDASEERKDISTRELYEDLDFLFKSNKFKTISIKISGLRKQGYVVRDSPLDDQNIHHWRLTTKGKNKILDQFNGILANFMREMIDILSQEEPDRDKSTYDELIMKVKNELDKQKVLSNASHIKNEMDKLKKLLRSKIKYGGLE